jgi:hypothetical protein
MLTTIGSFGFSSDHEDDQQHQHHVDVRHDVDLGFEFAFADAAPGGGDGHAVSLDASGFIAMFQCEGFNGSTC